MKISTILDQFDMSSIALPEVQRGLVWNRDQVRPVVQSLYRRFPVGSLLVWTPASGEPLAILDLAWREGMQPGLSEPVALPIDETTHDAADKAGFRFFRDVESLKAYTWSARCSRSTSIDDRR